MKKLLNVEEAAQLLLAIALLPGYGSSGGFTPLYCCCPTYSMIGYVVNAKTGAFACNLIHYKAVATVVGVVGCESIE